MEELQRAADIISGAKRLAAFTGAGISVESGIPPFRGEGGIWDQYDPQVLELSWFLSHPKTSWIAIRDIFYRKFHEKEPNDAHYFLATLESRGQLELLITQNIDELHFRAGSRNIAEYHGNARQLVCLMTGEKVPASAIPLEQLADDDMPPMSPAGGLYKPDFIFFGEGIPARTAAMATEAARNCDVMLVIGSTGEVYPAAYVPKEAKQHGATVIEINPGESAFTRQVADFRIAMKAGEACARIADLMGMEIIRGSAG
jgi:NAD-dependent deacetylase